MNALELHLIINHVPIFASIFGGALLLYGAFTKHKSLVNFGIILIIAGALITIGTFLSGEGAEKIIEHNDTISESAIEEHEENAKIALWMFQALGALSIVAFIFQLKNNKKYESFKTHPIMYLVVVYSVAVIGMMVHTGNTGGKIRRPEFRIQNSFNPNMQIEDTTKTIEK